jgi:anti-sigma factor (TIGR02949 family)
MKPVDIYTCEETFRRLEDYVDRELSEEESKRVEEHLEICAACTAEFEFQKEIIDAVRVRMQRIQTPPSLHGKVLDALRQARQESSR